MENKLTDNVNFSFIRYANCWEDAEVLLSALNVGPEQKILSIASAGDNTFALLLKNPEMLVAVDVNETQLFLVELKRACFLNLEYDETLQLLGFKESGWRKLLFSKIEKDLTPAARAFWNDNIKMINSGIVHQGKFEKYFKIFCTNILPWIHSRKTIDELFTPKSESEQQIFYKEKWNTWRWRLLFRIFFSRAMMGKYGRDPQFLKQVKISVSDYILNKAGNELSSGRTFGNFILRYNLTAGFADLLPLYLQPQNYEAIRSNIHKLVLHKGFAEDAIQNYGKFDAMNLSNIFEYLDENSFKDVSSRLVKGLNTNGLLAYWNLMVPRSVSSVVPGELTFLEQESVELGKKDKGFFYSKFIIEQKK